jgi:hypothetical protein
MQELREPKAEFVLETPDEFETAVSAFTCSKKVLFEANVSIKLMDRDLKVRFAYEYT